MTPAELREAAIEARRTADLACEAWRHAAASERQAYAAWQDAREAALAASIVASKAAR